METHDEQLVGRPILLSSYSHKRGETEAEKTPRKRRTAQERTKKKKKKKRNTQLAGSKSVTQNSKTESGVHISV